MCQCTPNARTPCCRNCPYDLQIKWGLISEIKEENKMTVKTDILDDLKEMKNQLLEDKQ